MNLSDFDYHLPPELIAKEPLAARSQSRLLVLGSQHATPQHANFTDILSLITAKDCLIFNDTKVMAARIYGQKPTGGKLELLIERCITPTQALAHIRASKAPKPGTAILDQAGAPLCQVIGRVGDLFELSFPPEFTAYQAMAKCGQMPLPPYIDRQPTVFDSTRYQTVYANEHKLGAVAAPTAGLHFDEPLLQELQSMGVGTGYVTLHVGAGTFQPVRVENITEHVMHQEAVEVTAATCALIAKTKAQGGRVIAVGTTSLRSLEGAAKAHGGILQPFCGETDLFIYPGCNGPSTVIPRLDRGIHSEFAHQARVDAGFRRNDGRVVNHDSPFKVVDALITNFHLPQSTLLMLVSALGGYNRIMDAYQEAIAHKYRFFSYGDAMFIEPCSSSLKTEAEE